MRVEGNVHGAGVLAYEDFMDKASERVGGQSFFILPSSIHELLIIPDNGNFDLKSLENMVKEVNATTVDPADQLTDNVYHYDARDKVWDILYIVLLYKKSRGSLQNSGDGKL